MLAHKAVHEGKTAAEAAAGMPAEFSPLTIPLVEEIIADYSTASTERRLSLPEIAQYVSDQMGCDVDDMVGAKRSQEIVWPRQVAIYLCRELTDASYAKIGEYFGGRDHTTVLHGYNKVGETLARDEKTLWLINDLKAGLRGD